MFEVGGEAVRRARAGEGPTLIEAQTYRYHGHFGADNPLGYRTEEEEAYYQARDCIARLRTYTLDGGHATQAEIDQIDQRAVEAVSAATSEIRRMLRTPGGDAGDGGAGQSSGSGDDDGVHRP